MQLVNKSDPNIVETSLVKRSDVLPTQSEWGILKELCRVAVSSGLIPQKNPEEAITIALKGRELGIPPMYAFAHISVIQRKPACDAELQLALIYKNCRGAKIEFLESNETICRMKVMRPGEAWSEWSFTIEEAKNAGLTSKENWRKYPSAMLRARCISLVARAKFPDAIGGMSHTAEELGADVDEDGTPTVAKPAKNPDLPFPTEKVSSLHDDEETPTTEQAPQGTVNNSTDVNTEEPAQLFERLLKENNRKRNEFVILLKKNQKDWTQEDYQSAIKHFRSKYG